MPDKKTKPKEPFAVQAAKFSWIAPIAAMGISFMANNAVHGNGKYKFGDKLATEDRVVLMISSSVSLLLFAFGLAFAIIALMRMKQHGRKGILGHALAGLIVNGVIIGLMATLAILSLLH